MLHQLLKKAESKDGYNFDIDKFKGDCQVDEVSKSVDVPEVMKKIIEEKEVEAIEEEPGQRTPGLGQEIKDGDADRTYRYEDDVYVFSPGRVTYDFSKCLDVKAAEENLKECKSVNIALGIAAKKLGKPFWTVK